MAFPSITIPDLATLYYPRFTVPSVTQLNQFLPQSLSYANKNLIRGALNAWITIECLDPYINRKCFIFNQCYSLLDHSLDESPKMAQIAYTATSAALMCFFPTLGMFTITANALYKDLPFIKKQLAEPLNITSVTKMITKEPQQIISTLNHALYFSLFFTTSSTLTTATLAVQILSRILAIKDSSQHITSLIQKMHSKRAPMGSINIKALAVDALSVATSAYIAYYRGIELKRELNA